jgi:hypothetical protein
MDGAKRLANGWQPFCNERREYERAPGRKVPKSDYAE